MLREQFGTEFPIVFLTGARTETDDCVAGLLVGADDYVVKPYADDVLLARVRRLVERRVRPLAPAASERLTKRELEILQLLAKVCDIGRSPSSSSSVLERSGRISSTSSASSASAAGAGRCRGVPRRIASSDRRAPRLTQVRKESEAS